VFWASAWDLHKPKKKKQERKRNEERNGNFGSGKKF
jgi:hypothetical protein